MENLLGEESTDDMKFGELRVEDKDSDSADVHDESSSRFVATSGESETPRRDLKQCSSAHHTHCGCRSKLVPRNLSVDFLQVSAALQDLVEDAISPQVQPDGSLGKHLAEDSHTESDAAEDNVSSKILPRDFMESEASFTEMVDQTPNEEIQSETPEPLDNEDRRVVNMMCNIKTRQEGHGLLMTILVRMDDKMNRQLSCVVDETDTPNDLASELVNHGFIHEADRDKLASLIEESIYNKLSVVSRSSSASISGDDLSDTGTGILFYPLPATPATINSVS